MEVRIPRGASCEGFAGLQQYSRTTSIQVRWLAPIGGLTRDETVALKLWPLLLDVMFPSLMHAEIDVLPDCDALLPVDVPPEARQASRAQLTSGVISPYPITGAATPIIRLVGGLPLHRRSCWRPGRPGRQRVRPPAKRSRQRRGLSPPARCTQAEGSTHVANHPVQPVRRRHGRQRHPPFREGHHQGALSKRLWRFTSLQPGRGLGRIGLDSVAGVLGTCRAAPCLVIGLRRPGCPAHGAVSRPGPRVWRNTPRRGASRMAAASSSAVNAAAGDPTSTEKERAWPFGLSRTGR